jgi:hypothetical protein
MSQLLALSMILGVLFCFCFVQLKVDQPNIGLSICHVGTFTKFWPRSVREDFVLSFCTLFGLSLFGDAALSKEFIHVSLPPGRIEGQKMRTFERPPFAQQASRYLVHIASF